MDRNDWCPLVGMFSVASKHMKGSLIEIGCGFGDTTELLCKIAEENGEKVIAIDPFNQDPAVHSSYNMYPYENFIDRMEYWIDTGRLMLIRKSSNDPTVFDDIKQYGPFSCAYVDGVQTLDFVLNDLRLMDKLDVMRIGVDDFNRRTEICQVQEAVEKFVMECPYRPVSLASHPIGTERQSIFLDRV